MAEARRDFEGFFSSLFLSGAVELREQIERRVFAFFDSIEISPLVTLYDRLTLSLRRKDLIASFNWDPLLAYAYRRNGHLGTLPGLAFLHGNVKLGVCEPDKHLGWSDDSCVVCGNALRAVPLLYPVTKKDYSTDIAIAQQWNLLESQLDRAYFVTVFGWSAPTTDSDARRRIVDHIQSNTLSNFLEVEIIDIDAANLVATALAPLVGGRVHWGTMTSIRDSWLTRHPRLTCEALFQATMMNDPIAPCRIPDTESLSELQDWAMEFDETFPDTMSEGYDGQG